MPTRTAVVTGATGINGANMIRRLLAVKEELGSTEEWKVIGVSRSMPKGYDWLNHADYTHVCVDLLDVQDTMSKFSAHEGIRNANYLFFGAYVPPRVKDDEEEMNDTNLKLLKNTLNALYHSASSKLEHITMMSGGKYYGVHLGSSLPLKTPTKEDDPRLKRRIHYYAQEDFLADFCTDKTVTYSVLRPEEVIGFANKTAMNIGTTIAVYGSLCRELAMPMQFPGNYKCYTALNNSTDVKQLTEMAHWCWLNRHNQAVANQAYNCVNGDVFRWDYLWPKIAAYFGATIAVPNKTDSIAERVPHSWQKLYADKLDVEWANMVRKYQLKPFALKDLVTWDFADEYALCREYDVVDDMTKAREAGFMGYKSTEKSYYMLFDELKLQQVIPM